PRVDAGVGDATVDGFEAQVAGGLLGAGVPTFEDGGAPDDSVGLEDEPLEELLVVDDDVRHIAAGADDAEPGEAAATRSGGADPFGVLGAGRHQDDSPEGKSSGDLKKEV